MHTETITWYNNRREYHDEIPPQCLVKVRTDDSRKFYVLEAAYRRGRFIASSGMTHGCLVDEEIIECFAPMPTGNAPQEHCVPES